MPYTYQKNADGHFVCAKCGVVKRNQNTMHYHMKTHEGKLPFECSFCHRQFLHASTLELHKRAHHQQQQDLLLRCPWADCAYEGTLTKSNLLIHYVRNHCKEAVARLLQNVEGGLQCLACSKQSKSLTAFHYHCAGCLTELSAEQTAHLALIRHGPRTFV